MALAQVKRIVRLELAVADLARSVAFYTDVLGFERRPGAGGAGSPLALGALELGLALGATSAAPTAADDPRFQHFALVVADMAHAHARVAPRAGAAFSTGGPQQLPPENGGVVAWKFRDPDGHPLELLETPQPKWREAARARPKALVLGVDHTALACRDLAASLAFYTARGFAPGAPSHNRGPAQDRLDGLQGVDLRIATLYSPEEGPHIELLHYDSPPRRSATALPRDGDFIRTVMRATAAASEVRDPDGHALVFAGAPPPSPQDPRP